MGFRVATQPQGSDAWDDQQWLRWLADDGRLVNISDVGVRRCRICHGPLRVGYVRCWPCHAHVHGNLAGLFPASYSTREGLEPLIWGLKDNGQRWLVRPLGALLNAVLVRHWDHLTAALGDIDLVVPVPSHPTVRNGYDHVRAIVEPYHETRWASGRLTLDDLVRTRADRDGRQLDPSLYDVPDTRRVAGRRIALVDDTFTSGATLASAGAALRAAGAANVVGVTIGRQLNLDYELAPELFDAQSTRPFDLDLCVLEAPPRT